MFLTDFLLTEGGMHSVPPNQNVGIQQHQQQQQSLPPQQMNSDDMGSLSTVEFEDVKKYILYQTLKGVYSDVKELQLSNTNIQLDSLLEFNRLLIKFFSAFKYPELIRMIDNMIDGYEAILKLKLPKRIPHEFPKPLSDTDFDEDIPDEQE